MGKLFSLGVATFSLALSLALVTSGAVVARSAHDIDPPEGIVAPSRLAVIGDEDEGIPELARLFDPEWVYDAFLRFDNHLPRPDRHPHPPVQSQPRQERDSQLRGGVAS